MATMKLYARTNQKSKHNKFQGEKNWQVVTECKCMFPSGLRDCVLFPSGFACKVERCDIVQVFNK